MGERITGTRLRIRGGETLATLSVLVPAELRVAAKIEAAKRGISMTTLIRELLGREIHEPKEVA